MITSLVFNYAEEDLLYCLHYNVIYVFMFSFIITCHRQNNVGLLKAYALYSFVLMEHTLGKKKPGTVPYYAYMQ